MRFSSVDFKVFLCLKFFTTCTSTSNRNQIECILYFCSDDKIAHPKFLRNISNDLPGIKKWETPCVIKLINKNLSYREYLVLYHSTAYKFAKNEQFKDLIIENGIESLCISNQYEQKLIYEIIGDDIDEPIRPKYQISQMVSRCHNVKYLQLIVWLPLIINHNSIDLEISKDRLYLRTEKPARYELDISWPLISTNNSSSSTTTNNNSLTHFSDCFASFVVDQNKPIELGSKLILVSQLSSIKSKQLLPLSSLKNHDYINDDKDDVNDNDEQINTILNEASQIESEVFSESDVDLCSLSSGGDDEKEIRLQDNDDNDDEGFDDNDDKEGDGDGESSYMYWNDKLKTSSMKNLATQFSIDSNSSQNKTTKKQHRVSFSDYDRCLAYFNYDSVADLVQSRSESQIRTKTEDGKSTKKYKSNSNLTKLNNNTKSKKRNSKSNSKQNKNRNKRNK